MKVFLSVLIVTLAGIGFMDDAAARGRYHSHHGNHFDFHFGVSPYGWRPGYYRRHPPYWSEPRYWYEPRTVIIERDPPVYIQRPVQQPVAPAAPVPSTEQVWYYCAEPAGYYPYVQNCPQPWVSVDPRTVAPPPAQ